MSLIKKYRIIMRDCTMTFINIIDWKDGYVKQDKMFSHFGAETE